MDYQKYWKKVLENKNIEKIDESNFYDNRKNLDEIIKLIGE